MESDIRNDWGCEVEMKEYLYILAVIFGSVIFLIAVALILMFAFGG